MTGIQTYTIGALFRGVFRRELETLKFKGHIEDYKEVKGFLDSRFLVKASKDAIQKINSWIERVNEE